MTQTIINLGTGGAALNGQNGSTAGADTNDALFIEWPGGNQKNYVYLPGSVGNFLSIPGENALDITGDLTLIVHVAADNYQNGTNSSLIGKFNVALSYEFRFGSSNVLQFRYTTDGTTGTLATRSSTVAPSLINGQAYWLAVTFDANNGASGNDVRFWQAPDSANVPTTWTQVGSTVTSAGAVTVFSGTSNVFLGSRTTANDPWAGKLYRGLIASGIGLSGQPGGTTVLEIDTSIIDSGAATSFSALTGQTVTISRSTSGRKSVAVVSPVWLFGTDDYMEVADNALLDFDTSDSFTIIAAYRAWGTLATNVARVAKKANTTAATQGWLLGSDGSTATLPRLQAGDGINGASATGPARTAGVLAITAGIRNVVTDTLITYMNGTAGTAVTDTTTISLSNSEVMRIGRLSGAGTGYSNMELVAVAVFRRALSDAEISAITTYYQSRLS